jgi:hypothetical protein
MIRIAIILCAGLLLTGGCKKKPEPQLPPATSSAPATPAKLDPAERGKAIFTTAEYSATGLTCATCHAQKSQEPGRIYPAHSACGMTARGTWWIKTPAQFTEKRGEAATLSDAANRCIKAPYMKGENKLSREDAAALEEFLGSIADPGAKDGKPFLIQKALAPPVGGLKAGKENGVRIYEQACLLCHGTFGNIPDLKAIGAEFNPVQVMAKVRGIADWETKYKDAQYALAPRQPGGGWLAWTGLSLAYASEATPAPSAAPATGSAGAEAPSGDPAGSFAENSMPWYALDILSDQDVVDVSFYICVELNPPAKPAQQAQPKAGSTP